MADRMPNAVYRYRAQIANFTWPSYGGHKFDDHAFDNRYISDNGVFICSDKNVGSTYNAYLLTRSSTRNTYPNSGGYMIGGLNMNTSSDPSSCYTFGVTNDGQHSGVVRLPIWLMKSSTSNGNITYNNCKWTGASYSYSVPNGTKVNMAVDKVEVCYKTSNSEIVYITGISVLTTVNNNFDGGDGFIIARSVPISGDGFIAEEEGGSTNGSVVFRSVSGSVLGCIKGTNISATSATIISQSIPNSAMVSNDGICAVSCMCMADGNAAWLSHKNGIHKLYQGPNPLNGMPGEKITIKGHEFVCLAYGPFYARMS